MIIVGGTYTEVCFEPNWDNIYGSGFRAVCLFLSNRFEESIDYYTCADKEVKEYLQYHENLHSNLSVHVTDILASPIFSYDHPLKTPTITPRPDTLYAFERKIEAVGDDLLVYGMIESEVNIQGKKVVYDPQSPVNPKSFSSTGSNAEQLVTIVNYSEAKKLTGFSDIKDIRSFFLGKEKCTAFILKMGAKGALLFDSTHAKPISIPVFKTDKVWPIGSGDVFSAFFALNWFEGLDIKNSAILASKATALYCSSKDLQVLEKIDPFPFQPLEIEEIPSGQVYLAGPFFTLSERWLVNEAWTTLKGFGLKVFSPFHDVGHGLAKDVVGKDLDGLDDSSVVFAIIDGLDSGTLFEVGYAISKGKKVVVFVQNESEESLKMLEGTGCVITMDFTTALYQTFWSLGEQ